jgi:hypothetical protein
MQRVAATGLYERDFALWIDEQVGILRRGVLDGRLRELDVENVIEELEGLAKRDRRSLESLFTTLAVHLLKLHWQPERASRSWLGTILSRAEKIRRILDDSPSLIDDLTAFLRAGYSDARVRASAETGLPIETFPLEPADKFLAAYREALAGEDFGGEAIVKAAEEARRR